MGIFGCNVVETQDGYILWPRGLSGVKLIVTKLENSSLYSIILPIETFEFSNFPNLLGQKRKVRVPGKAAHIQY